MDSQVHIVGDGLELEVEGLDAIAGTPMVDIKPVVTEFLARGRIRETAARQIMPACG